MPRWPLPGLFSLLIAATTAIGFPMPAHAAEKPVAYASANDPQRENLRDILGDFGSELRGENGRVMVDDMLVILGQLGVNTYLFHIWNAPTDWDDLQLFLPKAAEAGINVWVVVGPATTGSPDGIAAALPFKGDYPRWAEEIAKLSLNHPNLKAWAIDKFSTRYNTVLSADGVRDVQARGRKINPKLRFLVVMGFGDMATWNGAVTPQFIEAFHDVVDGVIAVNPRHRDDIDQAWSALNDGPDALANEIRFPWERQSKSGDFAMGSRTLKVLPGAKHVLHFRERDTFDGPTEGYHFKQILVDDVVVWEQDVAGGDKEWANVDVDLSKAVEGKTSVTLAVRMYDKRGVGKFTVRWRLADLRAEGFEPGKLDDTKEWKATKQGEFEIGFGGIPESSKRRFQLPLIVVTNAEAVAVPLQARLEGRCEGVVTNTSLQDFKSTFSEEVRKSFRRKASDKADGNAAGGKQ
ncbi:MAG: hypothetical protein NTW19_13135 [Planctomycetota bacterium]|nr:hypothetical protein [Planctomycetota bacterium]